MDRESLIALGSEIIESFDINKTEYNICEVLEKISRLKDDGKFSDNNLDFFISLGFISGTVDEYAECNIGSELEMLVVYLLDVKSESLKLDCLVGDKKFDLSELLEINIYTNYLDTFCVDSDVLYHFYYNDILVTTSFMYGQR